jgi:aerobic C4-dicarboxylate transport protein
MNTTSPTLWYKNLTVQVLTCVLAGAVLGVVAPEFAASLKPLGDIFIKLIKMVIAPIIFITIVTGIASIGNLSKVGVKALLYFQVLTVLALGIGLVVVNLVQPGSGVSASVAAIADVSEYANTAKQLAATLAATQILPVEGLALLLGVDRFMSEARSLTNLIGNVAATIVIAKSEGEFNDAQASSMLASEYS